MKPKLRFLRELESDSGISGDLQNIQGQKDVYGEYHKTVLHFHTPASHDYRLLKTDVNKPYSSYEESEVLAIANRRRLFRGKITVDYLTNMLKKNNLFSDLKEIVSYAMIADVLLRKSIELAIITDHNTISGFDKLRDAVNIMYKSYSNVKKPRIQRGIEISCGDSLHVVGIFKNERELTKEINKFLEDNLVSEKMGTYLASWKVIEILRGMGAISYVAHFNTVNVFKDEFGYSGAYKKQLLSAENMQLVGLSNLNKTAWLKSKLKIDRGISGVTILYDEDSHELNSFGEKTFWLKGQELNFNMIENAVHDADISIQYRTPQLPATYVKSIYIDGNGFLGRDNKRFCVSFSTALNCIIGGRGTGKSTLLDCVSLVLSQKIRSVDELKNVCSQGRVILDIVWNSEDYYVVFSPAMDGVREDAFIRGFQFGAEHQLQYGSYRELHPNIEQLQEKIADKIQVFTIQGNGIFEVKNKKEFLHGVFKAAYSVNEMVKFATDDRITGFIMSQLANSNNLVGKFRRLNVGSAEELKRANDRIEEKLSSRKKKIQKIIKPFNTKFKSIRLVYKQMPIEYMAFNWYEGIDKSVFTGKNKWFKKYNINYDGLVSFLEKLTSMVNPVGVFLLFNDCDWDAVEMRLKLREFTQDIDSRDVENGIRRVTSENYKDLLEIMNQEIVRPAQNRIFQFLDDYYSQVDEFDLEFDINSYEHESGKTLFKSVRQLSLGQKVVALLDFVFLFGDISGDNTPLLLDQPEDNLDSSYVYKHLVAALRKEKDKRQVVIVTHNSTIVTNAKPEQVIALQSDNYHGWVKNNGYPTEPKVILDIINLLEGGIDSFRHKEFIYDIVLDAD